MTPEIIGLRARNLYAKIKLTEQELQFIETIPVGTLVEICPEAFEVYNPPWGWIFEPVAEIYADWKSTGKYKLLEIGTIGVIVGGVTPYMTNTRLITILIENQVHGVDVKFQKNSIKRNKMTQSLKKISISHVVLIIAIIFLCMSIFFYAI